MQPVHTFLKDFQWIHTTVGVLGNLLFVIGSVLFLWESTKTIGVWIFIVGSSFMFVGSLGSAAVKIERNQREKRQREEHRGWARA